MTANTSDWALLQQTNAGVESQGSSKAWKGSSMATLGRRAAPLEIFWSSAPVSPGCQDMSRIAALRCPCAAASGQALFIFVAHILQGSLSGSLVSDKRSPSSGPEQLALCVLVLKCLCIFE